MRSPFNVYRMARVAASAMFGVLLFASTGSAQLLDLPSFGTPKIDLTKSNLAPNAQFVGETTYDGTTLTIKSYPQWITLASGLGDQVFGASDDNTTFQCFVNDPTHAAGCSTFTIKVPVDKHTGALIGVGTDTDVVFRGNYSMKHWIITGRAGVGENCSFAIPANLAPEKVLQTGRFAIDPSSLDPDRRDLCEALLLQLQLNGVLLTGRVLEMGNAQQDATTGRFNFKVAITGGLFRDPQNKRWCLGATPTLDGDCSSNWVSYQSDLIPFNLDLGVDITAANMTGGFATSDLRGLAAGSAGSMPQMGAIGCTGNGLIGGRIWNDINHNGVADAGEPGIPGVGVGVVHVSDVLALPVRVTDADGFYYIPHVCPGDNKVTVSPSAGFAPSPLPSLQSPVVVTMAAGQVVLNLNFGYFDIPNVSSNFLTFGQGGWGSPARKNNPGQMLVDNFKYISDYDGTPDGRITIGGLYTISMSGALAVQNALPQGGKPAALTMSYEDPINKLKPKPRPHTKLGQLAGNVLALEINVRFSRFGLTKLGLGAQKPVTGVLAGRTVDYILALGNCMLGGATTCAPGGVAPPTGSTLDAVNGVIERININYEAGFLNLGYLKN